MSDDPVLLEKIIEDDAIAKLLKLGKVGGDLLRPLTPIAFGNFRRNSAAVGYDPVYNTARRVAANGAKMIGQRIGGSFSRLRHEIGDIHAGSHGIGDSGGNFRDEEVWKNTGIERAGAEKNQVSFFNGVDDRGEWRNASRRKRKPVNGRAARGNAGFSVDDAAVREPGDELDIGKRGRKDAAANGENFAADAHGFRKISGDMGERGQEKIAEIVADEAPSGMKPILKQAAKQSLVLRESHHAVADVARRKNAIFAAKTSGASAIIRNSNDCG